MTNHDIMKVIFLFLGDQFLYKMVSQAFRTNLLCKKGHSQSAKTF